MGNHQSNKQWTERLTYVFEALNTVLLNRTSFALAWLLLTLKGELLATVDNFRLRPLRAPRILIGVRSMSLGQGAPRYHSGEAQYGAIGQVNIYEHGNYCRAVSK